MREKARTEREKEITKEKPRDLENRSRRPPPKRSFERILHNGEQALFKEAKREILP